MRTPFSKTNFFLVFVSLLTLYSCGTITEEIRLNEDGSGNYTVYFDMIGSTKKMMMGMMQSVYPDLDEDSLLSLAEENIWKDFPAEVDSLIDFANELPDSVKEDPEKMKILSATSAFMRGSKKEGMLNVGASFQFSNLEELEKFQDVLAENQGNSGQAGFDLPKIAVDYQFDGKTFSRKSKLVDESQSLSDSTKSVINLMLSDTKIRTIVYLPNKVSQASKDQLVSSEGKKVTYEFSFAESIIEQQSSDFEIKMK